MAADGSMSLRKHKISAQANAQRELAGAKSNPVDMKAGTLTWLATGR
jgi:hypothetical protein